MMIDWSNLGDMVKQIRSQLKSKLGTDLPDDDKDLMASIEEGSNRAFNPVTALDEEQVKVYNEIKLLKNELDEIAKIKDKFIKMVEKYKTLDKFFTSSIELKHDLVGKVWRVNEKTGMVEVFDTELAKQHIKEMGLDEILPPGLFDSDDK